MVHAGMEEVGIQAVAGRVLSGLRKDDMALLPPKILATQIRGYGGRHSGRLSVLRQLVAVNAREAGSAKDPLPSPGSVAWKVHRERVLLLGWGRAILLQFAHPLVAAAVADHSPFRMAAWGRLQRLHRTVEAMLQLTFGSVGEVARVAQHINAIHDRVQGHLQAPAGLFPAGTAYFAHEPALLGWVQSTLMDSHLLAYTLYVGPLTAEERDRYCAEASGMGWHLGIPEGCLPTNLASLQHYMNGMLTSGEIAVTETARSLANDLLAPPALGMARPLVWLMHLPAIGLLPPPIRNAYGFPWDARKERALRLSVRCVRSLLPFMPPQLRYWSRARVALRQSVSSRPRGQVA